MGGADQLRHLQLHQLLADQPHRLAQHVGVLVRHHLPDDLLDRHALASRPSWCSPFVDLVEQTDDHGRRGGRNHPQSPKSRRPKPCVASAEALRTALHGLASIGTPTIPSDRVLHHAMGRDPDPVANPGVRLGPSVSPRAQLRSLPPFLIEVWEPLGFRLLVGGGRPGGRRRKEDDAPIAGRAGRAHASCR